MKRAILFLLLFIFTPLNIRAEEYIIPDCGKTIQQVLDEASDAVIIKLKAGTYQGFSISNDSTWGNPDLASVQIVPFDENSVVTIQGNDPDKPIIGIDGNAGKLTVILEGLVVTGAGRYGIKAGNVNLTLNGCEIHGITGEGIHLENNSSLSASDIKIYDIQRKGSPDEAAFYISNGMTIDISKLEVYDNKTSYNKDFDGLLIKGAQKATIKDSKFYSNPGTGLEIMDSEIELSNISAYENEKSGIALSGDNYKGNLSLSHVSTWKNGEDGIYISYDAETGSVLTYSGGNSYSNTGTGVSIACDKVKISNLDIYENKKGGIFLGSNNALIEGVKVYKNQNINCDGGGIRLYVWNDSDLVLRDSQIYENYTDRYGGGVYIKCGRNNRLSIYKVKVHDNVSEMSGGGVYLEAKSIEPQKGFIAFTEVEFVRNESKKDSTIINGYGGGGIYVTYNDNVGSLPAISFNNCSFRDNIGDFGVAGYFKDVCKVAMLNSFIYGSKKREGINSSGSSALYFDVPAIISSNISANETDYDIYFARSKHEDNPYIDATNSYWGGVVDEEVIHKRIYDQSDNTNKGKVYVYPPLDDPGVFSNTKSENKYITCEGYIFPEEEQEEGYGTIRGYVIDKDYKVKLAGVKVCLYLEDIGQKKLLRSTVTNESGFYVFNNIDISQHLKSLYPPPMDKFKKVASYTVAVSNAFIDAELLDQNSAGWTYYKDQEKTGVILKKGDIKEVNFELEWDSGKSIKKQIADLLIGYSPNNYKEPEEEIKQYVDNLINQGNVPPEKDEGLRRGVIAERGMEYGYLYADKLVSLFLESLGMMIGNAFADFLWKTTDRWGTRIKKVKGLSSNSLSNASKQALLNHLTKSQAQAKALLGEIKYAFLFLTDELKEYLPEEDRYIVRYINQLFKDLLKAAIASDMRGIGANVAKTLVADLVKRFKPFLLDATTASYCSKTKYIIENYIENNMKDWNSNDKEAFRRDKQKAYNLITGLSKTGSDAIMDTVYAIEATKVLKKNAENSELLGNIMIATGIGAGFAGQVKTLGKASKILQYVSNSAAIVMPLKILYVDLPIAVENIARVSFGLSKRSTLRYMKSEGQVLRSFQGIDTSGWTSGLNQIIDSTKPKCDEFLQKLSTGHKEAMEYLVSSGGLFESLNDLLNETEILLEKVVSVIPPKGANVNDEFQQYYDTITDIYFQKSQIITNLTDIFIKIESGDLRGADDPRYQEMINRVKLACNSLKELLDTLEGRASALVQSINGGTQRVCAVIKNIEIMNGNGESRISTSPQDISVTCTVENKGDTAINNLSLRLETGDKDSFESMPSDIEIGTLQPSEAKTVTWNLKYTGNLKEGIIWFMVRSLESGNEPANFCDIYAIEPIYLDYSLVDPDGDRIPVGYENLYGLNPNKDDTTKDVDADGLTNYQEWLFGTRADLSDTDGDGISDGDEIKAVKGYITDPLNSDTDGDGINDGQDKYPLDPSNSKDTAPEAMPIMEISPKYIVLSKDKKLEQISVGNRGSGEMEWVAMVMDPGFVNISPDSGKGDGEITVKLNNNLDLGAFYGSLKTAVTILDVSGPLRDPEIVEIIINGNRDVIKGDVNNDKTVDLRDAIIVLKILAESVPASSRDLYFTNAAIEKGKLTTADAIFILQKIAGIRN